MLCARNLIISSFSNFSRIFLFSISWIFKNVSMCVCDIYLRKKEKQAGNIINKDEKKWNQIFWRKKNENFSFREFSFFLFVFLQLKNKTEKMLSIRNKLQTTKSIFLLFVCFGMLLLLLFRKSLMLNVIWQCQFTRKQTKTLS